MRIVVDTNVLLVSISAKSSSYWLYKSIEDAKLELAYTTEIFTEYEEQISRHWNTDVATIVVRALLELPNVLPVTTFYKLNLITNDPDDNKFVDCAFAANADYIVTEDKDFNILKNTKFPIINVINVEQLKSLLIENL